MNAVPGELEAVQDKMEESTRVVLDTEGEDSKANSVLYISGDGTDTEDVIYITSDSSMESNSSVSQVCSFRAEVMGDEVQSGQLQGLGHCQVSPSIATTPSPIPMEVAYQAPRNNNKDSLRPPSDGLDQVDSMEEEETLGACRNTVSGSEPTPEHTVTSLLPFLFQGTMRHFRHSCNDVPANANDNPDMCHGCTEPCPSPLFSEPEDSTFLDYPSPTPYVDVCAMGIDYGVPEAETPLADLFTSVGAPKSSNVDLFMGGGPSQTHLFASTPSDGPSQTPDMNSVQSAEPLVTTKLTVVGLEGHSNTTHIDSAQNEE